MKFVTGTIAMALLFSMNAIGGENKDKFQNDPYEAKVKIAGDTIKETAIGSGEAIVSKVLEIDARHNTQRVVSKLPSERPLKEPRLNLTLKRDALPSYLQDTQEARTRLLNAEKRLNRVPREVIKKDVARYNAALEAEEKALQAIKEAEEELAKLELVAAKERSANWNFRVAKLNELAHKYLARIAGIDAAARIGMALSGTSSEDIGWFGIDDLVALAHQKLNDTQLSEKKQATDMLLSQESTQQNSDVPNSSVETK